MGLLNPVQQTFGSHDTGPALSKTLGGRMDLNTLLIIIVVVLLLGGGGFFFRRR